MNNPKTKPKKIIIIKSESISTKENKQTKNKNKKQTKQKQKTIKSNYNEATHQCLDNKGACGKINKTS